MGLTTEMIQEMVARDKGRDDYTRFAHVPTVILAN